MGAKALATFMNVPANPLTLPNDFRGAELFRISETPPITIGPAHPRASANVVSKLQVNAESPLRVEYHARGCAR